MIVLDIIKSFGEIKYQVLAAALTNVLCLAQGCAVGWQSSALPLLQSAESPLPSGPMTPTEAGWIGAIFSVGAFFGTLFFGILANYVGSRLSLIFCSFPITASWITLMFAQNVWHIAMARILSGLTNGGVFICISLFTAEIAEDHNRGLLCSLLVLCHTTGILIGFVGGAFLNYKDELYFMVSIPILFLCTFSFLPNSPQQLLQNNKIDEAVRSLKYYRNCDKNSSKEREDSVKVEFEKFKAITALNKISPNVNISDFMTKKALRGLIVCPVLLAVNQFSGTFTLNIYAATIFKESGSTFNPNYSTIVMGGVQIMGNCVCMGLIDRVGRKLLLLLSMFGSAVSLVITGIYSYYNSHGYDLSSYSSIPVVSLSAFIFVSSLGVIPIPYVMLSEVLPQKIRQIGATICTCSVSVFSFTMLKSFPVMLDNIKLYGCMWFFASVASLGFVFTLFMVKETKGKNLYQSDEKE